MIKFEFNHCKIDGNVIIAMLLIIAILILIYVI